MLTNIFIFFLGKHCNRLPVLTDTEIKRSEKVFERIGPGDTLKSPRCSILGHSIGSLPLVVSKCLIVERISWEMAHYFFRRRG